MDAGDYLKPLGAPVPVMIILKQGTAEVTVNNSTSLLEAGEHILIPAGELHAVQAAAVMQFYLFKMG